MSQKALNDILAVSTTLAPAVRNATANGTSVDLAGVRGNSVVLIPGTWTDGTHSPKLQESADNSTWTDVAAADQWGSFSAITSAGTAVTQEVSYLGAKRYIRAVMTVSGATTGLGYAIIVVTSGVKQP